RGIPGLVWREGGNIAVGPARPLVADLDMLPLPKRRPEPFVVGGVPMAFMIASRGCIGECAYCSIRAFGRDAGGPRLRMRDTDAVADEAASLYHDLGVRIILLQDDLFILPDEKKTIDRMRAITQAIRDRGVDRMLFWIKGRPDAITYPVVKAAGDLGAIHIFLGVENASIDRLRYLGRVHTPSDNARAISMCLEHGIRPSFNFMLFDPDCRIKDIRETIDFAGQYLDVPWNICRTEIFSGTRLLDRLRKQGRLEGDYRTWGYKMKDQGAEIMFRILRVSFHERAFSFDSLLNKLITLSFTRHVHEELIPGTGTDAMSEKVDKLIVEVYRDTIDELIRIMDFAVGSSLGEKEKIRDFAVETATSVNKRNHHWLSRAERLFFWLNARGTRI
ncbi:MAG: radical SAM protein, partial [Deltaproteobacteria bacterium]|nr:radical SAM protein [Deltaproteobacteria bacterium]